MEQALLSSIDGNKDKKYIYTHSEYKRLGVLVYLLLLNISDQSVLKREFHHYEVMFTI